MGSYLFRRLLNLIPILIGISFLSFVLINLSPSDPAEVAVRVNEVTPRKRCSPKPVRNSAWINLF